MARVATCLWFEKDGEAAARFYVSLLPNSTVDHVQRSPGPWPAGAAEDVILIDFTLNGQRYQALNGGSSADYGTAASISVECQTQAEVDRLWTALTADGGQEIMCGWLRDRWGVPWQIVPAVLPRLLADPDPAVAARAFAAMQTMVKLDAAAIERAARSDGMAP
jgi:predicted 3-demethylubiquinone-9 3-methyltransferase (glyoxalase superfamily)